MSEAVEMEVEKKKKKKDKKEKRSTQPVAETDSSTSSTAAPSSSSSSAAASTTDDDTDAEVDRSTVAISVIAHPLASRKLTKKLLRLVKKASKTKSIRRGVKETVKAIRKGEKGLLIIAGNITPIDVITHLPVLCEESSIPYVFVPAKEELGSAGSTKRPTSCVLVQSKTGSEHEEYYDEIRSEVLSIHPLLD